MANEGTHSIRLELSVVAQRGPGASHNGRLPSKDRGLCTFGQLAVVYNAVSLIELQLLHQAETKCFVGPMLSVTYSKIGNIAMPSGLCYCTPLLSISAVLMCELHLFYTTSLQLHMHNAQSHCPTFVHLHLHVMLRSKSAAAHTQCPVHCQSFVHLQAHAMPSVLVACWLSCLCFSRAQICSMP